MVRLPVFSCLFILSLAASSSASSGGIWVPATDSAVSYVGRWGAIQRAGQTAMATVNRSSQIYFSFSGGHIAGLFDLDGINDLEQIYVNVDDGEWYLFTIDRHRIEFFPAGLAPGRHRLAVVVKAVDNNGNRWLPPLRSAVIFLGFELDSGVKLEASPPSKGRPVLEFLGDSITQGDGILHADGGAVINSDALATYAWLTGEALATTHAQIAFSGQGVISSDSREVPPA